MLQGPDPVQAIDYICDLGLYPVIFSHSTSPDGGMMESMGDAKQFARVVRW